MKASKMKKISESYNRKKYRKDVIRQYKSIFKAIKKAAKKGECFVSYCPSSYRYDNGLGIIFRLFRLKNPSFKMDIEENNNIVSIMIKWS